MSNTVWPCPNANPPCSAPAEQPGLNLTAEAADPFFVFPAYFPPRVYPVVPAVPADECKETTEENMRICVNNHDPDGPEPSPRNTPVTYRNTAQSCTLSCPDGTSVTVTTPAGLCLGNTQAEANGAAHSLACANANLLCPTTYHNAAQTCTVDCPDSIPQSYTVAANSIIGADQLTADAAAYSAACAIASGMCGGAPPTFFENAAQSCSFVCADGRHVSITVPAQTYIGASQAEADGGAREVACLLAQAACATTPAVVYESNPQTCSIDCQGTELRYTTPAGLFLGSSQSEADGLAFTFACAAVALQCHTGDPTVPPGVTNEAQRCAVNCPGGGTFAVTVAAGTIAGATRAIANASANSLACSRAQQHLMCLGALPTAKLCINVPFSETIPRTGGPTTVGWAVMAGTLPTGLSLSQTGTISGTPTTPGIYAFTVGATDGDGSTAARTYALVVWGVTTASLPAGTLTVPYSTTLTQSGGTDPVVWSISSGVLPTGLALNASTGVIAGTPTINNGGFTVKATDADGDFCTKDFAISFDPAAVNLEYWTFNEASGNRIGSVHGTSLVPSSTGPDAQVQETAGKLSNAVRLTSIGSDQAYLQGTSALWGYPQSGMTWTGWVRYKNGGPFNSAAQFFLVFNAGLDYAGFTIAKTSSFPVTFTFTFYSIPAVGPVLHSFVNVDFSALINSWVFFRFWFDPRDGKAHIQLNNTAQLAGAAVDALYAAGTTISGTGTPVGHVIPTSVGQYYIQLDYPFMIWQSTGTANNTQWVTTTLPLHSFNNCDQELRMDNLNAPGTEFLDYDEVAIWDRPLTDAQASYIYNSGTGRTYPIIFP